MKIFDIIKEGGWASVATQSTTITPSTVKKVLPVVKRFVSDFNTWATDQDIPPIKMGQPLGSSAYYERDPEDTEYGDIDLQIIAPDLPDKTPTQTSSYYNKLLGEFINQQRPSYIHDEGKGFTGNPIFKVGEEYVQVDFVWATEKHADWAKWRSTPEHGLKGVVFGSMFASFGEVINVSIQSSGAQVKVVNGDIAPYSRTRKYDELATLSSNMETFGIDILRWMHDRMGIDERLRVSPRLKKNPGLDTSEIRSEQLAQVLRGLAESFELNNMYGRMNLRGYSGPDDLIEAFIQNFSEKMTRSASSPKYDKAETPEAKRKAQEAKQKILKGIDHIKKIMR